MTLPLERRRRLQELGLRALVKRRFGPEAAAAARAVPFAAGAAVTAPDGAGTSFAAVFADTPSGLGSALDLTAGQGAGHLYFFAELNSGAVARRAAQFAVPVTVVGPDGDFQGLVAAPAPRPQPRPRALAPWAGWMAAAGLDAEWENGVLTGEWLGLEVARATPAPVEVEVDVEVHVEVEVGVGRHDREANRLLHPDGPTEEVLAHAVSVVAGLRRAGAPVHPANQLARERWLRSVLFRHPGAVGLSHLSPGPAPEPRPDLRRRSVAPAWGLDAHGRPVVVVCSVGVDPDVVPQAADARCQAPAWEGFPAAAPVPELMVVVPEGDDHPLTRRLAGLLRHPAEVVTVAPDWRRWDP